MVGVEFLEKKKKKDKREILDQARKQETSFMAIVQLVQVLLIKFLSHFMPFHTTH